MTIIINHFKLQIQCPPPPKPTTTTPSTTYRTNAPSPDK